MCAFVCVCVCVCVSVCPCVRMRVRVRVSVNVRVGRLPPSGVLGMVGGGRRVAGLLGVELVDSGYCYCVVVRRAVGGVACWCPRG